MRLICPNCDAHYEVDKELVPPPGRDLQCSDCGHVWFQNAAPDLPQAQYAPAMAETQPDAPPMDEDQDEPGVTPLAQRSLDDTLLSVLREEAQREVQARAQETGPLVETQDEFPLEAGPRRKVVVRAKQPAPATSDLEVGTDETALSADSPERGSRRERLPDIEQINSTLRASGEKRSPGHASDDAVHLPLSRASRRGGFRFGFLLMLAMAMLAVLVYRNTTLISQFVPAMGPAMASYSNQVDKLRISLDNLIEDALVRMTKE